MRGGIAGFFIITSDMNLEKCIPRLLFIFIIIYYTFSLSPPPPFFLQGIQHDIHGPSCPHYSLTTVLQGTFG